MNPRSRLRFTISTFALAAVVAFPSVMSAADDVTPGRPNIVLIMADDMGYGDLGCYNRDSKIPTPNIDSLAKQGVRFTDAHSPAAVCVPTRYGLLTGRYPFRMQTRRGGPLIEPGRLTLASLLTKRGYETGCVGKWHLGFEGEKKPDPKTPLKGGPVDRGFGSYFGIPASLDIPPYYYIKNAHCVAPPSERIADNNSPDVTRIQGAFWRAGGIAPGFRHIDVLPKFAEQAIGFVSRRFDSSDGKPFFLYVALASPHTPWMPTDKFKGSSKAGEYGDFVVQVDDAVGRLLKKLDEFKMSGNTLVIFTSDNGPVWYEADSKKYGHRSTGLMRGMKGDAWEGGHRMPFIARWPGKIKPGRVSRETICHTDMLATFAAVIGRELPQNAGADSYNILPALLGEKLDSPIREATVHQSSGRVLAIRRGPWKLIPQLGSGGFSQPRRVKPQPGGPQGQLYDLSKDPSETRNLYQDNPAIVKQLTALLERYKTAGRSRALVD